MVIKKDPPRHHTVFVNRKNDGRRHTTYNYANSRVEEQKIYVMINSDDIPAELQQHVDIFYLYDGIRYIVGYCLPMSRFENFNFGPAAKARMIKEVDDKELVYQDQLERFKFHIAPLNAIPVHEKEFGEMISSQQECLDLKGNNSLKNRFYNRPFNFDPNLESNRLSCTRAMMQKFKLSYNPHLIPIRLPDGLECYMRLNLAKHCQDSFTHGEHEFETYHLREMQRERQSHSEIFHGFLPRGKLVFRRDSRIRQSSVGPGYRKKVY